MTETRAAEAGRRGLYPVWSAELRRLEKPNRSVLVMDSGATASCLEEQDDDEHDSQLSEMDLKDPSFSSEDEDEYEWQEDAGDNVDSGFRCSYCPLNAAG